MSVEKKWPDRPTVVIVGAGASGLMAAYRLADDVNVILLEAGADAGDPPPRWMLDDLAFGEGIDWGLTDAETGKPVIRAKVTGGCTSINFAAALRGQPWCYDEWGIPEWSWDTVAPVFAAIETDLQYGTQPCHGDAGPIPITRLSFSPIDDSFAEWAQAQGHAWVDDQNAPGVLGVGQWPTNMVENGRRWGAHGAIMPLIRDRVTIRATSEVTRLIIEDGICRGVELVGPNGPDVIHADHVILSAGAVHTPALLQRSGIGPAAVLADAGIEPVLVRDQVGENLQDHPWMVMQVPAADRDAPGQRPISGSLLRYEVMPEDHVEVHLYPHQAAPWLTEADPRDVLVGIGLMRAISRGTVRLTADGSIEVTRRHLSDPQDMRAFEMVLDDAVSYINDMVARGVFLPAEDPWWEREDRLERALKELDSYGHLCGTCRMGTDDDAVVAPDLSVRGIEGLSIADASVMPASPRTNIMLASFVTGWHGAELILPTISTRTTAGENNAAA